MSPIMEGMDSLKINPYEYRHYRKRYEGNKLLFKQDGIFIDGTFCPVNRSIRAIDRSSRE